MTTNAPKTYIRARFFPSVRLTLAAVILINPGKTSPTTAAKKPKRKGKEQHDPRILVGKNQGKGNAQLSLPVQHQTESLDQGQKD